MLHLFLLTLCHPQYYPGPQHRPPLPSTADGSSVASSYCCHSAGKSISNNCSLHASSSMYLLALSLDNSSDHTVPLRHVLALSSTPSTKAKFPSLTCRKSSSSTFSLFPDYPLHLLSFAGLWLIDSVLSTTCFLPSVWRKFHLQISSAGSPFSPSQPHYPLALSTKNSTSPSSSQTLKMRKRVLKSHLPCCINLMVESGSA